MKILFLDIDGVLNSKRSAVALGGYPHSFSATDMAKFDHVAIALIRKLCKVTSCSIVLSSTWRLTNTAHEVANALDLPIIDCTPELSFAPRGVEIESWLSNRDDITHYAIVDDIDYMLPEQKQYFVKTDDEIGLTLRDYNDLAAILNRRKNDI